MIRSAVGAMTLTTGWSAPAAGEGADGHGEGGQPPTPPTASASNASNDLHGLTDSAGHRLRFTQTPRLHARHPAAQRWRAVPRRAALSGAPKTRNDRRYAATLAATAAAEFLKPSTPRGVQSDTCRQPIRSGLTQRERRGQGCRGADGPGPSQLFAPRYSGVTSIEAAGNGVKRLSRPRE